jgi:ribosomal protein S25
MMHDPFTAKIVSRDARDFARNRRIKKQANKEEGTMAITEKTIRQIRKDFDKHNERVLKIFRRNGDKSLLELLYLNSDNPEEVAEEFGISLEDAASLVEKDKAAKAAPLGTMQEASRKASAAIANLLGKSEEHELYTKAFEYVASTGCEDPSVLADKFGISEEQAAELLHQMRENGDIACEDENEESDYEDSDDSDNDFELADLFKNPEKIIEDLCFLGDVIQDTSEKICDALDESAERVMEHDFYD